MVKIHSRGTFTPWRREWVVKKSDYFTKQFSSYLKAKYNPASILSDMWLNRMIYACLFIFKIDGCCILGCAVILVGLTEHFWKWDGIEKKRSIFTLHVEGKAFSHTRICWKRQRTVGLAGPAHGCEVAENVKRRPLFVQAATPGGICSEQPGGMR